MKGKITQLFLWGKMYPKIRAISILWTYVYTSDPTDCKEK